MATKGIYNTVNFQALEDLNSHQYQAFAFADGKVANNGGEASGIIMNKPKNKDHASVAIVGESKYRAGDAVSAGGPITVTTSGYFTAAGSGDYVVGRAKAAVTSGSLGVGVFNFINPVYASESSFAWA